MDVTHSPQPTLLARLADWSYRRRKRVLLLWIVLLVGPLPARGAFGGDYGFTFSTPGSNSQKAQDLLESGFPARAGDNVDVVFQTRQGKTVDDPTVRAAITATLDRFAKEPHVSAVVSPYSAEGAGQIAKGRTIAYGTVRLDQTVSDYKISDAKKLLALGEKADRPGLRVGAGGLPVEGAEQSSFSSEGVGLLVAALILLVSFGSLLAMGLPILIAIVGLGIGLSLVTLTANVLEVPDFAPQVAAMIGIGVGIDYVLFIVTRYRWRCTTGSSRAPR